jgi:hypothetical protein
LPASKNFEEETLSKYFRFSNLHFENIYSLGIDGVEFNKVRTTGIYFDDAFANDVIVEDCYFTDLQRTGVWLKRYVSDAVIRNNKFIDLGGSGTIISASKRVLYEHNIMRFSGSESDSRMAKRGSGMWVYNTDDMVAQYNLSQHARGDGDSSGMHVDYGNSNILFQYNYSEDSAGGFCETLGDNDNVIWRYNVSVNDGTTDKSGKNLLLWVSDFAGENWNGAPIKTKSDNVYIYNNTIYQGKDYKNVAGDSKVIFQVKSLNFLNNIIYLESDAKLGKKGYTADIVTPNFNKNIIYGGDIKTEFKNLDASKIEQDPLFLFTGTRQSKGYKLQSGSPALGAAYSFTEPTFPLAGVGIFKDITSKATKDIYGNPVDLLSSTNIGAYNGPGETYIPVVNTYEAEDGDIVGGNIINSCSNGSNGKAVNVGKEGKTLTINNINVPITDTYLIKVFYANSNKSNLKVTLNNDETETIILPYSDAYCYQGGNPTSFDFIKTLNLGNNTIKLEQGFIDKIEVVSINDATLSNWQGITDNNWHTPSNWSTSLVPTSSQKITIPSGLTNYPTATSAVSFNTMTIKNGATFIPENNTVTGEITYERNLPNTDWYLISPPVSGEIMQDLISNHSLATGSGSNVGLANFVNTNSNPWNYKSGSSTGVLNAAQGYSIKLQAAADVSFRGNANTSDVNYTVSGGNSNNFYLLGNPFTSYVNSTLFLNKNTTLLSEPTIWLWDGTTYQTYNLADPLEVAPAQGFFVDIDDNVSSQNIVFETSNQSHQSTDTFMREAPIANFELSIESDNAKSATKVFYVAGKTTGFDNGYDSKLFSGVTNNFSVYTELVGDKQGEKLAIQTLDKDDTSIISVGVIANVGKEITFSLESENLNEDVSIYLEDKLTGAFINVSETTYKATITEEAQTVGRFYIHTTGASLSTENLNTNNISIYKSSFNEITINGLTTEATFKMFSVTGKEVMQTKISLNGSAKVTLPSLAKGVYIVQLTTEAGKVNKKIILE